MKQIAIILLQRIAQFEPNGDRDEGLGPMAEALNECMAVEKLCREWDSGTCPSCGSEKWAHSPFCRHCSIRLQRANMFRDRVVGNWRVFTKHKANVIVNTQYAERWLRWYDRCRDWLMNPRRNGDSVSASSATSHES